MHTSIKNSRGKCHIGTKSRFGKIAVFIFIFYAYLGFPIRANFLKNIPHFGDFLGRKPTVPEP